MISKTGRIPSDTGPMGDYLMGGGDEALPKSKRKAVSLGIASDDDVIGVGPMGEKEWADVPTRSSSLTTDLNGIHPVRQMKYLPMWRGPHFNGSAFFDEGDPWFRTLFISNSP